MNYIFKTPLLFAVLGLSIYTQFAFADTNSGSSSTVSAQDPKTSAKAADQSGAKTSTTTTGSDAAKGSTRVHPVESSAAEKEDSASPHAVVALQGPVLFKILDTDKDGRISLAEFVAYGKAADPSSGSGKTSPGGNARSDSRTASRNVGTKSDAAKTAHSESQPATSPEATVPDTGVVTSTNTRAGRYTAEVFENLDINHDKFLSQAELDALIPAHQISQP